MNKRVEIPFLNTAKTICMFLVVLAHLPIPHELCAFISTFRMPLFFFISGYLVSFKASTSKEFFIKKFKTLVIPYFFFAIVSFFLWYVIGRKYGDDALKQDSVVKFLIGIFYAIPSKEYLGFNLPIWFLPALFCAELIFHFCRKWFGNREYLPVAGFFLFGILVKNHLPFRLPWGIDVSFFVLIFMYLGFLMKKQKVGDSFFYGFSFTKRLLLSSLFLGITIVIGSKNNMGSYISVWSLNFNNYFLFIIGSLSGILFILFLSSCLKNSRMWHFYGRNTIVVLGFHTLCFSFIKAIQVYGFKIPASYIDDSILFNLLYVVCAFALLAPVIYIINRYFPFLLGREQGII